MYIYRKSYTVPILDKWANYKIYEYIKLLLCTNNIWLNLKDWFEIQIKYFCINNM